MLRHLCICSDSRRRRRHLVKVTGVPCHAADSAAQPIHKLPCTLPPRIPTQPMHACTPACCNAVATDVGYHILVKAGHRAWHVGHADRQPEKRRLCWGEKCMHACKACGNNRVPRLVLTQGKAEAVVAAHPQRGSSCLPSLSCCWALAWAVAHLCYFIVAVTSTID